MLPLTDALRNPRIAAGVCVGGFPRDIRCLDRPPRIGVGPVDGRACALIDTSLPPALAVQKCGLSVVDAVVLGHGNAEEIVENSGKFAERAVSSVGEVGKRVVGDPQVTKIVVGNVSGADSQDDRSAQFSRCLGRLLCRSFRLLLRRLLCGFL